MHSEVHILDPSLGHVFSTDCWCEPVKIIRRKALGLPDTLIVEHDDFTALNHNAVLKARSGFYKVNEGYATQLDANWITDLLNNYGNPPNKE